MDPVTQLKQFLAANSAFFTGNRGILKQFGQILSAVHRVYVPLPEVTDQWGTCCLPDGTCWSSTLSECNAEQGQFS